ncbi:MAG TPA: hypothetical protein VIW25_15130 [Nitrososphaeraceae archaeon]
MPRDETVRYRKRQTSDQYFLIQVSKYGSESILRDGFYQHENWMDTHHDADHGNVRIGDILIIYFASNSIKFPQQIKKVYRVSSVSENNFKPTVYDTALLVSLYFITYLGFSKIYGWLLLDGKNNSFISNSQCNGRI